MPKTRVDSRIKVTGLLVVALALANLQDVATAQDTRPQYFDHHVHALSPTLIAHWKSVGMRFSRAEEAYTDPQRVLKDHGIAGAFLVSMAHLYGTESFHEIASVRDNEQQFVQAENDFIAQCVANQRQYFVGFFSVNPLAPYAIDEMTRCKKSLRLTGLKLHLPACGVDLHNTTHAKKLRAAFAWAERTQTPILLHLFSGAGVDPSLADQFWQLVKSYKNISLYVAHLGASGGYNDSSKAVLDGFELLCEQDPGFKTARIWFDVSGAILTEAVNGIGPTSTDACASLAESMRRIGLDRFVFATDYPVFSANATRQGLREKLLLTDMELNKLLQNRSPEFGQLDKARKGAKFIWRCDGLTLPETVCHDPQQDRYFVSCMVGNPTAHDNNGEIRVIEATAPETSRKFVCGGTNGVTLNGPKGMALNENTLWVADIETLRGFDVETGRATRAIELKSHGAIAINDIAIDDNGNIYVSDPRLVFDNEGDSLHSGVDRIFVITSKGKVRTLVESKDLSQPNGLAWDPRHNRLLVAPLNSKYVLAVDPASGRISQVARSAGRFDGIEVLPDGSIAVSCLREGTIRNVSGRSDILIVAGMNYPGNFGIDQKRRLLLVPLITAGCVEAWAFDDGVER